MGDPSTAAMPPGKPASSLAARERRKALIVKLQIAGAVFGPMLLLGVWLQSKGFFGSPGF
jgi:hypothetical protein